MSELRKDIPKFMKNANDDRAYVRNLAKRVMDLVTSDEFEVRRRRFRDLNDSLFHWRKNMGADIRFL